MSNYQFSRTTRSILGGDSNSEGDRLIEQVLKNIGAQVFDPLHVFCLRIIVGLI
jgi:hypothetical protein